MQPVLVSTADTYGTVTQPATVTVCVPARVGSIVPYPSTVTAVSAAADPPANRYTVNYAGYPRFVAADRNGDGPLCIRHNDPKYTVDLATLKIYDNDPRKA